MATENEEIGSLSGEEVTGWISLGDLKKALEELPTPLRTKVMNRVEGVGTVVDPEVVDLFLEEVTRKVFGFSLADLAPSERREIEFIKMDLGLPGESNLPT